MSIAAKDVMALRQKTGLGMMDCKEALNACDGDMSAAEEWIRAKHKGKMDTRTERTTGEGRVASRSEGDNAAIVEVATETDFTARNDDFIAMMETVVDEAIKAAGRQQKEKRAHLLRREDKYKQALALDERFGRQLDAQEALARQEQALAARGQDARQAAQREKAAVAARVTDPHDPGPLAEVAVDAATRALEALGVRAGPPPAWGQAAARGGGEVRFTGAGKKGEQKKALAAWDS